MYRKPHILYNVRCQPRSHWNLYNVMTTTPMLPDLGGHCQYAISMIRTRITARTANNIRRDKDQGAPNHGRWWTCSWKFDQMQCLHHNFESSTFHPPVSRNNNCFSKSVHFVHSVASEGKSFWDLTGGIEGVTFPSLSGGSHLEIPTSGGRTWSRITQLFW